MRYNIKVLEFNTDLKIPYIKVVRHTYDCGLRLAKMIVDNAPTDFATSFSNLDEANKLSLQLQQAG